jgi:hypothetical protein
VVVSEQLALDQEENLRTASGYYLKALAFVTAEVDASEYMYLSIIILLIILFVPQQCPIPFFFFFF